jgi:hypothetical protein
LVSEDFYYLHFGNIDELQVTNEWNKCILTLANDKLTFLCNRYPYSHAGCTMQSSK